MPNSPTPTSQEILETQPGSPTINRKTISMKGPDYLLERPDYPPKRTVEEVHAILSEIYTAQKQDGVGNTGISPSGLDLNSVIDFASMCMNLLDGHKAKKLREENPQLWDRGSVVLFTT